ncbi:metallophosphoesterase [Panacibacter sp. DH6]|uniref:Metallophosphoesterase n=1 Tax=Panacibacter microcysteis TaxID=2793269 RepID=A0A931GYN0_9BACT|nr:metallophosphoesterase [Panacibacter microcysteis]MBG9376857.1 metallophosphoesterase [Panacibacter microcysteis]
MRSTSGWWIVIVVMLLIDLYVFMAIRTVTQNSSEKARVIIHTIYWVISAAGVITILLFPYVQAFQTNVILRNYVFAMLVGLFFAKVLASTFFLVDDLRRGAVWLMAKIFPKSGADFVQQKNSISRSAFLTWAGIAVGGGLFTTLLYGFSNKYNYNVRRLKLTFANLPSAFRGLRIIQVSDIHSGSFTDKEAVKKGVEKIMEQKPDLILFTGDLVNDRSDEMDEYMDVFNKFSAPLGVYSTLGNHDYGDYVAWPSEAAKAANLERLKQIHGELGWRLLMNEHVVLEKDGASVALLGIENWSAFGRFPKYGKMAAAYAGTEKYPFKILMSHDPSHWDAEVRTKYPDINLMLSGHTHGMQFGLENPYFKWSPVQWFYKQWAGLYKEGQQMLYVNRGYGFIGYPGRVGIMPEITVIELA